MKDKFTADEEFTKRLDRQQWELVAQDATKNGLLKETYRMQVGNGWIYAVLLRPDNNLAENPDMPMAYDTLCHSMVYVPIK